MGLSQWAAGDQRQPFAPVGGPGQPLDGQPQRPAAVFALDGVGDKSVGANHSGNRQNSVLDIAGNPGNFGERSAGALLHHPQVRAAPVDQQRRLLHQPAVNAAHAHDQHQQEPNAERGQHKPPEIVFDVFQGQIHDSKPD
ncbi:hypothetical protein SDC9_157617 [bioreactor metagenome]|uniref:Uncharacterized protein n=1 Tax=bioreactor metagenome TaxID=1076179 RepID=A0A645F9T5_9ZZZZ